MTGFDRASEGIWILSDRIKRSRRRRLLQPPSFEGMVETLWREALVERVKCEKAPNGQSGHRSVVVLRTKPHVLDQFFNSASGYRAQYLLRAALGDKANRLVIRTILPEVLATLDRESRSNQRALVKSSLLHPWAKVWIHQGLWLRRARREHRVLLIPAWQRQLSANDRRRRKLVRWGALAPSRETRFLLKGGYVRGRKWLKVGKPSVTRARELHELGFT